MIWQCGCQHVMTLRHIVWSHLQRTHVEMAVLAPAGLNRELGEGEIDAKVVMRFKGRAGLL